MIRKSNNKGLSLIELIVAVAILAVVGVAIMGFVAFSSRNYSQANKNVKLQYEQQMTVNRIRDVVLETSRAIAYDDSTKSLTVFSDTAGSSVADAGADSTVTPIIVSRIYFTEAAEGEDAGKLYILTNYLGEDDIKDKKYSEISLTGTASELTDTVNDFSADLSNVGNGKVTLNITFKVGTKEVEVHPEIALRNIIEILGDDSEIDELYTKEVIEFTSNVAKVEISRDGKVFGQAKTDTIAMSGDTTTVDYDAIVTKKKYFKGDIVTTVTWEIEGLKAGYENNIILDTNTGRITLKNTSDGKTPKDYIEGETFILKAISDEDPTKIARLRVKVTTGGLYPVEIDYAETHDQDLEAAQLVYKFTHKIKYTDQITNSAGQKVNPLTGKDVYSKIKYTVYEADKVTLASIPNSAGFSATKTDGVFRVVKAMEEHTYMIKASVLQKDKDGNEVCVWIKLDIAKGAVPDDVVEITKPELYTSDEYRRADYNSASVQWTNGTPKYTATNGNKEQYYVWYEWEIEPVDGWNSETRSKFNDNAYFVSPKETDTASDINPRGAGDWTASDGKSINTMSTDMKQRVATIFVRPRLDWTKTYTLRVSLRAKLSKTNNSEETYYTLKSGVKIYPYNMDANEVIANVSNGTKLASDNWRFNDGNGGSIFYNNQWRYIDKNDVVSAYGYRPDAGNGIYLYSGPNGTLRGNIWNMNYGNVEIRVNQYSAGAHPYHVTFYSPYYNRTYSGWVDSDRINLNSFKGYYTNKDTKIYSRPIQNGINTPIYIANGGEEVSTPDGVNSGRVHVKFTANGSSYDGYTNGNWWGEVLERGTRKTTAQTSYYKLPTDADNMEDILTDDKSEAYVSSTLVTIKPVSLTLKPAAPTLADQNNNRLKVYCTADDTVYLGKGREVEIGNNPPNAEEAYRYYGVERRVSDNKYHGYLLYDTSANARNEYYEYYKCYIPTFEGINVTLSNADKIIGGVRKKIGNDTALQPYAYIRALGTYQSQNINENWYECGYIPSGNLKAYNDYNLYIYVKMIPFYWGKDISPFPTSVKWTCIVDGKDNGNFVKANSGSGDYFSYRSKYELNP